MSQDPGNRPCCHVVAGPDGAGKSTFALRYLPRWAGEVEYVNPDLIAQGDSPLSIRLSAFEAGKKALLRIRALAATGRAFAFETTLAGRGHLSLLDSVRAAGYEVAIYYLWLPSPGMLPVRIRHRVLAGGHDVPEADVVRRFDRSRGNLRDYASRSDRLLVFDAQPSVPELVYRRNVEECALDAVRAAQAKKDLGL